MTTTPPNPPDDEWPAETTAIQPPLPPTPPPPVAPPPDGEPGWSIGLGMLLAIAVVAVAAAVIAALLLTRHHDKAAPTTTVVTTTAAATTTTATATAKLALPVPNLVGRTWKEASAGLRRAGFHITLVTVPSALPRGTVVAQDPAAGTSVARGSDVRLNVSGGSNAQTTTQAATTTDTTTAATTTTAAQPSGQVPSLSGELQPAVQRLDDAGFIASVAYVPGEQPLGTVIQQSPAGGSSAPANSEVTVNVSSGPKGNQDETVPDVAGQKIPQAVQTLHQAGLRLIFLRSKVTDKSQAGVIQAQTPKPGEHAPKNAQVLVYMGAYTQ